MTAIGVHCQHTLILFAIKFQTTTTKIIAPDDMLLAAFANENISRILLPQSSMVKIRPFLSLVTVSDTSVVYLHLGEHRGLPFPLRKLQNFR